MIDTVTQCQTLATLILNSAFAWLIGALYCLHRLGPGGAAWQVACSTVLTRSMRWATLACLGSALLALVCAVALMGDTSLDAAVPMLPQMLLETRYGHSALAGLLAMGLLLPLFFLPRRWFASVTLLLSLFALARANLSHAGEAGLFSVATALEWLHLILVGLWVGLVAVVGWIVLPAAAKHGATVQPFLGAVSGAATLAVAGIVASGLYNAWHRIATLEQLSEHSYGVTLMFKLAMVALAAMLGAYNRYIGFPAAVRRPQSAIMVLRLESLVLLGALAAAAALTLQAPPQ